MSNKSHKSFFMPMLCRFSLTDTIKPTDSSTPDPSSPKLTCIGQIKKRSTITTTTNHHSNSYTKLHKLFSTKTLISPSLDKTSFNKLNSKSADKNSFNKLKCKSADKKENKLNTKSVTYISKSCNGRNNRIPIKDHKYYINHQDIIKVELDPPLPVVKCHRRDNESNLWKRRGIEMKTLQIEPIKVNLNQKFRNNNGGFSMQTAAAATF